MALRSIMIASYTSFSCTTKEEGCIYMISITGQQLCLLLIGLWGFITSVESASLRFLNSEVKPCYIWLTSFHPKESDGWRSLPSDSLSLACHIRCSMIFEDLNILLNLGIGGNYHKTFARTPFLIFPPSLFIFHLHFPQVGHVITSLY